MVFYHGSGYELGIIINQGKHLARYKYYWLFNRQKQYGKYWGISANLSGIHIFFAILWFYGVSSRPRSRSNPPVHMVQDHHLLEAEIKLFHILLYYYYYMFCAKCGLIQLNSALYILHFISFLGYWILFPVFLKIKRLFGTITII